MTCLHCNDTGSKDWADEFKVAYLDCTHCDAAELYSIPGAVDRLVEEAPRLRALLAEYLDPVLPRGMTHDEWKLDFDTRVRCALLRIAGPQALKREAA